MWGWHGLPRETLSQNNFYLNPPQKNYLLIGGSGGVTEGKKSIYIYGWEGIYIKYKSNPSLNNKNDNPTYDVEQANFLEPQT